MNKDNSINIVRHKITMRIISFLSMIFLLLSCSTEKKGTEIISKEALEKQQLIKKVPEAKQIIEIPVLEQENRKYANLDSTTSQNIAALDKNYAATPFYSKLNGRTFYVICTGEYNYDLERFGGTLKYGLSNDSLATLLEPIYDKIYNPNLVLLGCFEIKLGSKVGLINYSTGEILHPQFDFILPCQDKVKEIAYGFKNQSWFEIKNSSISEPKEIDFDPIPILSTLSFSIMDIGENMMFDSYFKYYEDDANEGRGVVIVPSYIEYLKLFSDNSYVDVILPDQQIRVDFGTETAKLKTSLKKEITDKLSSFFISVYESGISARGYEMESKELIVYNKEQKVMNSVHLGELHEGDYFCRESGYRFVNDSIIEIKSNNDRYSEKDQIYDFETRFTYHKILPDGSVKELTSNRHFDFTKFIFIEENHLRGCYANFTEKDLNDGNNIWISDHLSINDLDIMRNEIFAEYGYKFQSAKWQYYFANKPWYEPLYDDVNHLLTEIDKANVQRIIKVKEMMLKDEEKYTNKRPSRYVVAG